MVNLRKDAHGEGSMKAVNLAVISYDKSVSKDKEGAVAGYGLDVRVHPDDRRAENQRTLALVTKEDKRSPNGYNNSVMYAASQMDAIVEAAGDNASDVLNKDGERVGTAYAVKADLMSLKGPGLLLNSKTLAGSDFGAEDVHNRVFDKQAENRAAMDAAAPAVSEDAPQTEAVAEQEQASTDDGPGLG